MTLTQREIEKKVGQILSEVQNDTTADGIDVLAAALASALVSANATGLFDKNDLHPFLVDLENRIAKTLKVLDTPKRDNIRMKRAN